MAEVTQLKRYDAPRINWGKWFLIGAGVLVSALILVVPTVYIFVQAFSKGLMPALENLANPDMLHAIWLTVLIALIAVPVNLVFGVTNDFDLVALEKLDEMQANHPWFRYTTCVVSEASAHPKKRLCHPAYRARVAQRWRCGCLFMRAGGNGGSRARLARAIGHCAEKLSF